MIGTIERAAISSRPEDISAKLRNAPSWVRSAIAAPRPATQRPKPPQPQARSVPPVIGWIFGTCCPGVSRPAFLSQDGETLPEQFTGRCIESFLRQVNGGAVIPLTWRHRGDTIASSRGFDLIFHVSRHCGLEFECRVRDTELGRKVLSEIDGRSLGVSIGFTKAKSWTVERDGVGRIRVVDEATLDHVAVLPRSDTAKPAYSGARCYGAKDASMACLRTLRRDAEAWAFRFIAAQAGVKR